MFAAAPAPDHPRLETVNAILEIVLVGQVLRPETDFGPAVGSPADRAVQQRICRHFQSVAARYIIRTGVTQCGARKGASPEQWSRVIRGEVPAERRGHRKIGRASCREGGWQYV